MKTKEQILDNPTKIPRQDEKIELESIEEKLSIRQEKFCELYTTDTEFFGNWAQSYLEVYDIDRSKPNWYKTACVNASKLLSNAKVYTRINDLLESQGLNNEFADKQLLFLMSQQVDFTNKLWAVREFNKLKKRIDNKMELEIKDLSNILSEIQGK